jgi:hypothetical protein
VTGVVSLGDVAGRLDGLVPLSRRVAALDPRGVLRIRLGTGIVAGYARLPFAVLVGRTVRVDWAGPAFDCVVRAGELVSWLQGQTREVPTLRDVEWRGALPPARGWHRVDRIPDAVIRDVVRKGAATFRDAAAREGVPGGQPRAEVADALLDSVVLTAAQGGVRAEVSLRTISAMTRMGFVPDGSQVAVDVCGRWSRVAGEYGSAYAERPGLALGIVS